MKTIKHILIVIGAALALSVASQGFAAESADKPKAPMAPTEPQLPPPPPESTCADWPYCLISIVPGQSHT